MPYCQYLQIKKARATLQSRVSNSTYTQLKYYYSATAFLSDMFLNL